MPVVTGLYTVRLPIIAFAVFGSWDFSPIFYSARY